MELLENQKQNKFQTFSCGRAKVTFDENGYIVNAKDFSAVMWCTPNQDEELIGKHIIELAKILKIIDFLNANYKDKITLTDLSNKFFISKGTLIYNFNSFLSGQFRIWLLSSTCMVSPASTLIMLK